MTPKWSNTETAKSLTIDEQIAVMREAEKAYNEFPFRRSVVPAQSVTAMCRNGLVSPEEARRWLDGHGMTLWGGPKSVDEAIAALTLVASKEER